MLKSCKKNSCFLFFSKIAFFGILTLLTVSLLLFQSSDTSKKIDEFNEISALNTIKVLASEEYQGRFPGTSGNDKTKEFIQNHFQKIKMQAKLHQFDAYIPVWYGQPELKVIDHNNRSIKTYTYRKDYREIISGLAQGGSLTSVASFADDSEDIINAQSPMILADNALTSISDEFLKQHDVDAFICVKNNALISRKSVLIDIAKLKAKSLIKLQVTQTVFDELLHFTKNYKYKIVINIPLTIKKIPEQNIYAVLDNDTQNSIDFSRPVLIISAHFDHLGTDPNGAYFPGALDNASGLATMLGLAVSLQKYKELLTIQILFIAFNAEEEGLLGSWAFSKEFIPKHLNINALNIDMVGAKEQVPLSIVYNESFYKQIPLLIERIKSFFNFNTIEINEISNSNLSDHYSLGYNWKIPAVTINEFPLSHYHTSNDTVENTIDINRLDLIGEMLIKFIKEQYVNNVE